MCIGIPAQVLESGSGWALVAASQGAEKIDTRLVAAAPLPAGQWVLVFQGAARELICAERAREIEATLALLGAALHGDADGAAADAAFTLPSAMSREQLQSLTGADHS